LGGGTRPPAAQARTIAIIAAVVAIVAIVVAVSSRRSAARPA
jgi:hypothetical protein